MIPNEQLLTVAYEYASSYVEFDGLKKQEAKGKLYKVFKDTFKSNADDEFSFLCSMLDNCFWFCSFNKPDSSKYYDIEDFEKDFQKYCNNTTSSLKKTVNHWFYKGGSIMIKFQDKIERKKKLYDELADLAYALSNPKRNTLFVVQCDEDKERIKEIIKTRYPCLEGICYKIWNEFLYIELILPYQANLNLQKNDGSKVEITPYYITGVTYQLPLINDNLTHNSYECYFKKTKKFLPKLLFR